MIDYKQPIVVNLSESEISSLYQTILSPGWEVVKKILDGECLRATSRLISIDSYKDEEVLQVRNQTRATHEVVGNLYKIINTTCGPLAHAQIEASTATPEVLNPYDFIQ